MSTNHDEQHVVTAHHGPFVEILAHQQHTEKLPDFIEAYVSRVEPCHCGPLLKELSAKLPLGLPKDVEKGDERVIEAGSTSVIRPISLSHLKRVRRIIRKAEPETIETKETMATAELVSKEHLLPDQDTDTNERGKKRKRHQKVLNNSSHLVQLEVVMGMVQKVDSADQEWLSALVEKYGLQLEKRMLPGRPAESKQELEEYNQIWPTVYFHKQTQQHKLKENELTKEEIAAMEDGIKEAIQDAARAREQWNGYILQEKRLDNYKNESRVWQGSVIICPQTQKVVARASEERLEQLRQQGGNAIIYPDIQNPLCTPTLLAMQGVSRVERQAAMGYGMDSATFMNGQYLCTGYDLYTTKEPGVFEAMALVHSRIRHVVFGIPDKQGGGLGGTKVLVHSLPGTNHKYRVFYCAADCQLRQKCHELQNQGIL